MSKGIPEGSRAVVYGWMNQTQFSGAYIMYMIYTKNRKKGKV